MPDDRPATTETPAPPISAPAGPMAGPPRPPMPMGPTAPATVAPDSQGMRMRGVILATMGLNVLDQAAALLGSKSEEGQALMKALVSLRKTFGTAPADLSRQEVKMLGERAAPVQAPTPQQGQAFAQMIRNRLGGMGLGGGGTPSPVPTP